MSPEAVEPVVESVKTYCPKCRCEEPGVEKFFLTGETIVVGNESFLETKARQVCPECLNEVVPVPEGERRPSRKLREMGSRYLSKTKRAFKGLFFGDTPKAKKIVMPVRGIRQEVISAPYLADKLAKETMTYEDVHISSTGCVYKQHFNRDGKPAGLRRVRDPKAAVAMAESILAKVQEAELKTKAQLEANKTGSPVTITAGGKQITAEPEKGAGNASEIVPGAGQPDAEGCGNAASDQQRESEAVDRAASDPSDSNRQSDSPDAGASLAA